jgi:hypothetical protein
MAWHGHGSPPEWRTILEAAKAWGVPPWELEETAPALWIDRLVADMNAEAKANEPKRHIGGTGSRELI